MSQDTLKVLHRAKALDAYKGAKVALEAGANYSAYLCLKEAVRGLCCYVLADQISISQKTKLKNLLDQYPVTPEDAEDIMGFYKLVEAESGGLSDILSMDAKDLKRIRKSVKRLIGLYMDEDL